MAKKSSELFNEKWIEGIKKSAQQKLEKDVDKAVNKLSLFYLEQVQKFYAEYSPILYKRHPSSSVLDSGLGLRTFTPIKRSFWKGDVLYVLGGISLNTYKMYPSFSYDEETNIGYRGRNDWVLYTFSQGIHGLPDYKDKYGNFHKAIERGSHPLKDTQKYAEQLRKELNKSISLKELRM